MFWKKSLIYPIVLFCFMLSGGLAASSAAAADNADLITVLKDKNVLTDKEAEQLKKSGDASVLPPALRGFRFSTTIFAEWNSLKPSNDVAGSNTGSSNQFALNRAYLTLLKDVTPWLSMNFTADLFTSKDADDKGNGLELRMKYAYAALKFFGTTTYLGLIPTPSDSYDSSIWPYRVQGKHLWDELGIQASADFGIANQGVFGGYMDEDYLKYASKAFAGKWGGWMAGIYNGPGYSNSESNNNKVASGLVYLRPLPGVPVLKGLQLAYVGSYGKSNSNFATGVTTDFPDWQANIAQASLQNKWFAVMGQYYWGKATATSNEENKRKAWLVDAFVRVPGVEKARVFGKYYNYTPNTEVQNASSANNGWITAVGGISYDVSKEFMPYIAWEHRSYDIQTASLHNSDKYQVGFQLKF